MLLTIGTIQNIQNVVVITIFKMQFVFIFNNEIVFDKCHCEPVDRPKVKFYGQVSSKK